MGIMTVKMGQMRTVIQSVSPVVQQPWKLMSRVEQQDMGKNVLIESKFRWNQTVSTY